jgi:hypothetical protein
MTSGTFCRCVARLSLHDETDGALVLATEIPVTLEVAPTRHPVPYRAHYGPVPGGWRPTRLLALADLLDCVLPHREDERDGDIVPQPYLSR